MDNSFQQLRDIREEMGTNWFLYICILQCYKMAKKVQKSCEDLCCKSTEGCVSKLGEFMKMIYRSFPIRFPGQHFFIVFKSFDLKEKIIK